MFDCSGVTLESCGNKIISSKENDFFKIVEAKAMEAVRDVSSVQAVSNLMQLMKQINLVASNAMNDPKLKSLVPFVHCTNNAVLLALYKFTNNPEHLEKSRRNLTAVCDALNKQNLREGSAEYFLKLRIEVYKLTADRLANS